MVTKNELNVREGSRTDLAAQFLSVKGPEIPFRHLFPDIEEEAIVQTIIRQWALEHLNVMLNYVYFETEPMEDAVRYSPLDFSKIDQGFKPTRKKTLPKPSVDPKKLERLRTKIKEASKLEKTADDFPFTPPNYDEIFFEAVEQLNEDQTY